MITGDNAITADAIGASLGLGPGAISGGEFQALSDEEIVAPAAPAARLRPRDARGQAPARAAHAAARGMIVAATGDAVNDAAALKQADIGVAMGSGSEVTKQAARMILTDDNFGTLVHAVELGRKVYDKVVAYVRYQMTQLLALVMLFVAASAFDINDGVALTPLMVLYLLFFATAVGRRDHRRRSRRPGRHAPAAARPEAADHQPRGGRLLGALRGRALRRRALPAGRRAGRPQARRRRASR